MDEERFRDEVVPRKSRPSDPVAAECDLFGLALEQEQRKPRALFARQCGSHSQTQLGHFHSGLPECSRSDGVALLTIADRLSEARLPARRCEQLSRTMDHYLIRYLAQPLFNRRHSGIE